MKLTYLSAGLIAIALTGCHNERHDKEAENFFPDQKYSAVRKLAYTHSSSGARSDGMLYAHHFDGEALNTLGKQKLSLMLSDETSAKPLTVYLVNTGSGDLLDKRKRAVTEYVHDGLRPDERVDVVVGTNPSTIHPSAHALSQMAKTESGSATGDGATTGQPQIPPSSPAEGAK